MTIIPEALEFQKFVRKEFYHVSRNSSERVQVASEEMRSAAGESYFIESYGFYFVSIYKSNLCHCGHCFPITDLYYRVLCARSTSLKKLLH